MIRPNTVADLAEALGEPPHEPSGPLSGKGTGGEDEDLIHALAEALRRVEGRQLDTEGRVERIERGLEAATRPAPPTIHPRSTD